MKNGLVVTVSPTQIKIMMKKIVPIFTIFLIATAAVADITPNLNVATTSFVQGAVSTKQDLIDSSHKLSADLVDATSTTNQFVTASEKSIWNAKQGQLQNDASTPADVSTTVKTSVTAAPSSASDTNLVTEKAISTALSNKQNALDSTNVVQSGSGAMVTSVTANSGTVTVTKSEVTIPVGATTSNTRAIIWFE